ncbi:MAG: hypothetical protein ACRDCW_06640 [Sarcina sp.]
MSTINMVEVLKSVGYSATGVAGQKTRLAKAGLGLGDEAKDVFMFNKEEALTMLSVITKSKSDKAVIAGQIFDKIGKDQMEEAWLTEYTKEATAGSTKKSGGASTRKGSLQDLREFIETAELEEKFKEFMVSKYGA